MENLLESSERTLVIFDSVCSGLAECLALVHGDIKQMTEHRNKLAKQLEHEQQQLRALPHDSSFTETDLNLGQDGQQMHQNTSDTNEKERAPKQTDLELTNSGPASRTTQDDDDPHHLARLKLLDKRLADSFSQALSMCDQQKSSLVAKKQAAATAALTGGSGKPSIFQVLLGKGNKSDKQQQKAALAARANKAQKDIEGANNEQQDKRIVIDDINRQTRLAMQYSKQLEAHLFKVEDLRAKYEMHLKMGLVVKSVSRAYMGSSPYNSSSLAMINLPSSLGRRTNHHHSSTLMVNDRSSLGTRSSLSSLNLSTWSFSRRQHSDRSAASGKNSTGAAAAAPPPNCCSQMSGDLSSSSLARSQKCVSTISLDSMNKQRSRRSLNLNKLISLNHSSSKQNQQLNCQDGSHYVLGYPTEGHIIDQASQQAQQQFVECQCNNNNHHTSESPQSDVAPLQAPSRPVSQYIYGATAEFATPTTTGTLAGGYLDAAGSLVMGDSNNYGGGGGGSLHKSASHSSLKKAAKSHHHSKLLSSQANQHAPQIGSKTTIKEFIDNIERVESEFESYMGSFLLNIEDIQGFARVCQGDVFEINIKYGDSQKFKTKISVLKNGRQKCDHKQTVFKARIADVMAIKAYECKGLGKRVLLGDKPCETRDLFTARSQLMTISLNQTGSIKLNLIITWNPLHMTPKSSLALQPGLDISHISLPPTPVSSSTLSSLSSAQSSTNGAAPTCGVPLVTVATTNNTTMINIQSSNNKSKIVQPSSQQQASPVSTVAGPQGEPMTAQYHYHPTVTAAVHHHQVRSPRDQHHHHQVFQDSDAIYSYHIPEPDYLTTGDLKY